MASQKRQTDDRKAAGSADVPDEKRQKVPALRGVILEAMKMNALQKMLLAIEPLVRKVVKEEVESALTKHLTSMSRQCGKQVYPSITRRLQLQFKNKLMQPIFTGSKVEAEDYSDISVTLVDASTGQVVTSGPESSMKVEIVVLEGDFDGGEEDSWTSEEFKNNIVREREGKRSLLTGDVFLDLNEGIGTVGELSFTDNSSWTRSRKFRLGARATDGYCDSVRVMEAKSEPFMVKDHRGELYKKHYPPALSDEVWRLEKIGKDGAFHKRLTCHNIHTVKDFLLLLSTDATSLRNILGSGMSARMWEVTVEHARTCILTDHVHVYFSNGQTKMGVVFNIVGEVLGITSGEQFVSVNDLQDKERAEAYTAVKLAYEHWSDVVTYNGASALGSSLPDTSNSFSMTSQSSADTGYNNFPSPIKPDSFGFNHSSILSPDIFSMGTIRALDAIALPAGSNEPSFELDCQSLSSDAYKDPMDIEKCSNTLMYGSCGSQSLFGDESLQQYFDSSVSLLPQTFVANSPADLGSAITGFLAVQEQQKAAAHGRARRWRRFSYVFGWAYFIRRIVARKKVAA